MSERPDAPAATPLYFHVRKEDVHAGSALDVDPPFASFDVVLRRDYDRLRDAALAVLDYENHPSRPSLAKLRTVLNAH